MMILNFQFSIYKLRSASKMLRKSVFLCAFTLFIPAFSISQSFNATSTLDTNEILIGDQVLLKLFAEYPTNETLNWPMIGDTLTGQIEVVEKTSIDTVYTADQQKTILSQTLTLTSFDSGYFVIPPFRFSVIGDDTIMFETEPLLLTVHTIEIDTSKAIKDIKSPLDLPLTFEEYLPYILIGVAIFAIVFLILYYLTKRLKRKPEEVIIKKPKIPPHRTAIEKLQVLEERKLWQQGKMKPYHSELTEIVRIYIEKRFKIIAMELTTDEIIANFNHVDINKETRSKLKQILSLADMVKFAKVKPIASEHELSLSNAYDFVRETIPMETEKDSMTQNSNDEHINNQPESDNKQTLQINK